MVGDGERLARRGRQFSVEDYVKPEFTIDVTPPASTVGGDVTALHRDARYLFGRPAAGLRLRYTRLLPSPYALVAARRPVPWRLRVRCERRRRSGATSTVDAAGRATIAVRTPAVHTRADAEPRRRRNRRRRKDRHRRQRVAQVTPASFYLAVASSSYFVAAGDDVGLTIRSRTYTKDGFRAGVPVTLTFTPEYYAGGSQYRDEAAAETRTVVTDAGRLGDRALEAGSRRLQRSARAAPSTSAGARCRPLSALWVASARYAHAYRFDDRVGRSAKARVPARRARGVARHRAARRRRRARARHGRRDGNAGRAAARVAGVDDRGRHAARRRALSRDGHRAGAARLRRDQLGARGRAGAAQAHRRDPAGQARSTRRASARASRSACATRTGKPVRAQVGDRRRGRRDLRAARGDRRRDAFRTLYGYPGPYRQHVGLVERARRTGLAVALQPAAADRPHAVAPVVAQFVPGQTADVYNIGASQPSLEKLRSDFRDTAYWSPAIVTDAGGHAVGELRLARFAHVVHRVRHRRDAKLGRRQRERERARDQGLLGAALHAALLAARRHRALRRARARHALREVGAAALLRTGARRRRRDEPRALRRERRARRRAGTCARAASSGARRCGSRGRAARCSDGLRVTLPVETSGTAQHERAAGSLPERRGVALRLDRGAEAGDLRIDLAPSIVAQLLARRSAAASLSVLLRRADDVGGAARDLRRAAAQARRRFRRPTDRRPPRSRNAPSTGSRSCSIPTDRGAGGSTTARTRS